MYVANADLRQIGRSVNMGLPIVVLLNLHFAHLHFKLVECRFFLAYKTKPTSTTALRKNERLTC